LITTIGRDGWLEETDEWGRLEGERQLKLNGNECGWCGRKHPTDIKGWRDEKGFKRPCPDCEAE